MSESVVAGLPVHEYTVLRQLIARVLMVSVDAVTVDSDLVYELGAESIDFLDLLFSLDELAGQRVLPETWSGWLSQRLPDMTGGRGITPAVLAEFVVQLRATGVQPNTGGAA